MGRVATLVKTDKQEDRVYGVAYEIHSDNMQKTFEYLNVREKCGYSLKQVVFYPNYKSVINENQGYFDCLCYFANEDNPYYSPDNNAVMVSNQIYRSIGPSGPNKEYLFNLCETLRIFTQYHSNDEKDTILKHDSHLFELENYVKKLEY